MYHIWYELEDGCAMPDGSTRMEIATTRPETLLGDTAVAVHPEDPRYTELVGKTVKLPLTGRNIPVIADTYVDREFGTGVVKITPAHDPNDWEVSKRHNLEVINILNPDGTLNDAVPEKYRGLSVQAGRKQVLADLEEQGLFKEKKNITHAVGKCYRCNTVVEPYLSDQWFVKMRPLADKAWMPERRYPVLSPQVGEYLCSLDGKHPRLVHFPSALVGTPHSGVVLRFLRQDDRVPRGSVCLFRMRQYQAPSGP